MKKYRCLSRNERDELAVLVNRGHSLRKIAFFLGRSHTSLSREIKRHGGAKKYRAVDAHLTSLKTQKEAHRRPKKLAQNKRLLARVRRDLKKGWSPELIAGRLRHEGQLLAPSHEAIYRWIYSDAKDLIKQLVRSHPQRRPRWRKPWPKRIIPHRVSIIHRPIEINKRQDCGHWEVDLLCGSGPTSLQVLIERKTRFVQITRVPSKTPKLFYEALLQHFSSLHPHLRQSITYDNGIENILHYHLNRVLFMKSYFCEPYHSWEKGTVENTNGLIRRFLKKGSNLATISDSKILTIRNWLNNRPRKCLNFLTPAEAFNIESGAMAR